jgi:hypothetical protein
MPLRLYFGGGFSWTKVFGHSQRAERQAAVDRAPTASKDKNKIKKAAAKAETHGNVATVTILKRWLAFDGLMLIRQESLVSSLTVIAEITAHATFCFCFLFVFAFGLKLGYSHARKAMPGA